MLEIHCFVILKIIFHVTNESDHYVTDQRGPNGKRVSHNKTIYKLQNARIFWSLPCRYCEYLEYLLYRDKVGKYESSFNRREVLFFSFFAGGGKGVNIFSTYLEFYYFHDDDDDNDDSIHSCMCPAPESSEWYFSLRDDRRRPVHVSIAALSPPPLPFFLFIPDRNRKLM